MSDGATSDAAPTGARVGRGRAWIGLAVALALWGYALASISAERVAQGLLPAMADDELRALEDTAGLGHGDAGQGGAPARVPVLLTIAGPSWVDAPLREAIARRGVFELDRGPHGLQAEMVVQDDAAVLSLRLERRGWAVRAPIPTRRRLAPALALVPALLAGLVWLRTGRIAAAVLAAGVLAQLLACTWPWPAVLPSYALADELAASPLLRPLLALARGLDDGGVTLGGGVIAACLVLAWFDHRRSRERPWAPQLLRLVAVLAACAWLEAAVRVGVLGWLHAPLAIGATLVVVVAHGVVHRWGRAR